MSTILGIGGQLGHDSNAALIVDGKLIGASQEERFSRKKHDGAFPTDAISDCLSMAALDPREIELCVFDAKPLQSLVFDRLGKPASSLLSTFSPLVGESKFLFPNEARKLFTRARFGFAWHHLTHAAGAFSTSPFDRAAFLCVDGKGENVCATVGIADHGRTEILFELPYANGLGLLYTLVTYFLGFPSFGSEYKVMGLAPYGQPVFVSRLREFVSSDESGALKLKMDASFAWTEMQGAMAALGAHLGIPIRNKSDPLEEHHIDLAASLQALFEEEVLSMASFARRVTGEKNLLFCGGCAQNCVVAGKLRRSNMFESVFNSPVGGDMGTALGAAALGHQLLSGKAPKLDVRGYYLGCEPGEAPAEAMEFRLPVEGPLHQAVARLLADGNVVGWIRGRMELGARALGARSILADPRVDTMQSVLNLKVKFRESFRPFAPAILAERCGDWFDTAEPSDFMQYTAYLKKDRQRVVPDGLKDLRARLDFKRCEVPSIVHVDFSARIQTVHEEVHPDFHLLISEFEKLTGVPILINTSFNVSGQPIVRTADEAWQCFRHTDMDYLVLNDAIFRNPRDKTREEKLSWLGQFESFA